MRAVLRCPTKKTPDENKENPQSAHYHQSVDAWAVRGGTPVGEGGGATEEGGGWGGYAPGPDGTGRGGVAVGLRIMDLNRTLLGKGVPGIVVSQPQSLTTQSLAITCACAGGRVRLRADCGRAAVQGGADD